MPRRKILWPPIVACLLCLSVTGGMNFVSSTIQESSESTPSKPKLLEGPPGKPQKPYFDDIGPRNVTAVVGQSALLNCRVKHLGDKTVSWMRKRDLHILTSSIHTYTGDGRFSVRHPEHSDDWDLRIEYVQKRDAGVYECQVNTEPKISLPIMLNVDDLNSLAATHHDSRIRKDAQASIAGPREIFVKKGSTISLTCIVNVHSTPPSSVLWYHGHSVVDFDSPRGGISLETEKTEAGTTSKLLVTKARIEDTGNYTCMPSNASPASASVHVLNGEHPAAMQTSSGQHCIPFISVCMLMVLMIVGR
ncbi:transmembrane and immunoglobulin domain-containing protein 1-like isoform X1 [Euwallacea fornicatus]|uniref:transmembrane and immunoglobulin domain-containing protein 1-like isoform X1 n=1 Tax=Euwallacea fornicatus TaxID=995702 RepID=UPI00338F0D23